MESSRPVVVLQNLSADGPGYLGTWLAEQGIAFDVFDAEAGNPYPWSIAGYRALALLGGEMSANDDLPSLRQAERLILQAIDADIPVIGHCLGGQLMARALGARVIASPKPEIGWQAMQVADTPAARRWFGEPGERIVYHWHGESFELPAGAELLAGNASCPHQAFAIGRHLALQFHVELDACKLAAWSASCDPSFVRLQREYPATVQTGAAMRAQAGTALPAQLRLADRMYGRWLGIASPARFHDRGP
ncbi:MAG TPA: type 1 glutamine amidotransferase [Burkholderiaceae bacterium]|nr:type 1 glutamine amidotransferase [Burkholderiaceae bacterium]